MEKHGIGTCPVGDLVRCRCGVYKYAHQEGRGCGDFHHAGRLKSWYLDHSLWPHVVGCQWLHTPERWRWRVVGWLDRPSVCWCDLCDSAGLWSAEDYACGCDVPLPWDAGAPRPGWCYCPPPERRVVRGGPR